MGKFLDREARSNIMKKMIYILICIFISSFLYHCSESTFSGTSSARQAKKVVLKDASQKPAEEDQSIDVRSGESKNVVVNDSLSGEETPVIPKGEQIVDYGPCAGRKKNSEANKARDEILFYVPIDRYGGSSYYRGIKEALEGTGYTIQIVNAIDKSVAEFDACNLWANYTQIWMFLPCRDGAETKSMDANSLDALKLYYTAGGGLVVFTDYHYDNDGAIHCAPSNWGESSDIKNVKEMLGINYTSDANWVNSGYAKKLNAAASHPLAPSIARITNIWNLRIVPNEGINFTHLDDAKSIGIIERKINKINTMALIISSAYGHEFSIQKHPLTTKYPVYMTGAEPEAFIDIANYFRFNLRSDEELNLIQKTEFSLLDEFGEEVGTSVSLPYLAALMPPKPELTSQALVKLLTDENPIVVGDALKMLAKREIYGFSDILPFFEHDRFPVRIAAVEATTYVKDTEKTVATIYEILKRSNLSKHLTLGLVRSLGALGLKSSIEVLQDLLNRADNDDVKAEIKGVISQLELK